LMELMDVLDLYDYICNMPYFDELNPMLVYHILRTTKAVIHILTQWFIHR
jgi:hypothetical protein